MQKRKCLQSPDRIVKPVYARLRPFTDDKEEAFQTDVREMAPNAQQRNHRKSRRSVAKGHPKNQCHSARVQAQAQSRAKESAQNVKDVPCPKRVKVPIFPPLLSPVSCGLLASFSKPSPVPPPLLVPIPRGNAPLRGRHPQSPRPFAPFADGNCRAI